MQARAAAEAADARVAAANFAAAHARAARAAREASQLAQAFAAVADTTPLAAEHAAAAQRRTKATAASEAARRALAEADAAERTGLAAREEASTARAAVRAALAALEGEAAALRKATARTGGDRLLDHVAAAPGWEQALAAALDDDLATPLGAWSGAAPLAGDPPPPSGAVPLADGVTAPAALARRLGQVFVADADSGQPLAVGQRLVTRAGALRRWDGYRAASGGAAAAAQLQGLNRLVALEADRTPLAAHATAADIAHARAERAVQTARQAAATARVAQSRAETDARDAARAEDRALAALERLAAQRADLDARATQIATEEADAAAELTRADAAAAAVPDGVATRAEASARARDADAARGAVASARGERIRLDAVIAAARERLAGVAADARNWRARAGEAARRVADADKRETALTAAQTALADQPDALRGAIAAADAAHGVARAAADAAQAAETEADASRAAADLTQRAAAQALGVAREARAGALARVEAQELRRVEMGRVASERFACPAPVLPERFGFAVTEVETPTAESAAHDRLVAERERLGPVNLVAERELVELEAGAGANAADRAELGEAINRLRGSIGALNREGRQRLLAAYEKVDAHFRRLFTTLFNAKGDGGQAHLALVDADDPLEAGLEIMAQPPGKRLQSLTLLSGGEQALTAVALIFALFLTNPAPICVLDEVDAPLDDANIERFCDLLDRMAADTDTRYLIVTHNAVTMSRMHRLFGVTMIEPGVSRLVSVDLGGAVDILAAA